MEGKINLFLNVRKAVNYKGLLATPVCNRGRFSGGTTIKSLISHCGQNLPLVGDGWSDPATCSKPETMRFLVGDWKKSWGAWEGGGWNIGWDSC